MNLKALKALRVFHLLSKRKYDEKRQIELVKICPLFDAKWYLEQNPDVRTKKMGAARHYAKVGWKEGRNPSKDFNTKDYIRKYPELISKNWCPLFHYMLEHKELMPKTDYKQEFFNLFKKEKKNSSADYNLLSKSKYFDKKWYLKIYPDVKQAKMDPVEHYLKFGWKEGRNPGPKFSTEGYMRRYPDVNNNPLLHYELVGKKEHRQVGPYTNDVAINEYFFKHAKGKTNRVIYSCISGGYDNVITDFYPDPRYDYVLFTDSKKLLKNKYYLFWQVKPLQFKALDSVRNARWHKLHPHLLFPDYKYSVWIDSNVQIKGSQVYNYLEEQIANNHLLASAIHPYRNCLYQEAKECVETRKDNPEVVYQQIDIIKQAGFPKDYGLFETNVLFRQHNNERIISIMDEWWKFIEKYSRRDQLSFTYVLWKNNEKCYPLGNKPLRFNPEFKLYQHMYKPKCKINPHIYAGNQKGKLLVHLHLYYHEQLKYFISKLKNITCDYDLFVTYVDENIESNSRLKKFKKDVHLIKVPNKGYDLAPFVYVLSLVNLDDYRYILKLHTKNFRTTYWSYNNIRYIKYQWRNALVNALLGSKRIFKKNLHDLQNEFVGMIGNAALISHKGAVANETYRLELCKKLDYDPDLNGYIAGTMFICKSFLMKDIQKLHLTFDDFQNCTQTGVTGTLAHALESIVGHTVENNGMLIKGRKVLNLRALVDKGYALWVKFKKGRKHSDYWYIKHSKYFNKKWYLRTYPDVKRAKMDPVEHYLKFGWKEGRNPGPKFSTRWYLNRYKDVAAAKINPLLHYEKNGKWEGRLPDKKKFEGGFLAYISYIQKMILKYKQQLSPENTDVKMPIIVSLTTYPKRIYAVIETIKSILNQTKQADKVILWLTYEEFPEKEKGLPQELLDLRDEGLSIEWCHNLRSYNKLIPSLRAYPKALHITVDDDIIYPSDLIEKLYDNYLLYPKDIQCRRITKFAYNGRFYTVVGGKEYYLDGSFLNKLTGVGGVLYPPKCFYKDILNEELIKQLAPTNDDQWFWFQAVLQGTKIRVVEELDPALDYVENSQDTGLYLVNDRGQNLFWRDFDNLMNYYPQVKDIFLKELRYRNSLFTKLKAIVTLPYYWLKYKYYKHKYKKMPMVIKDIKYYQSLPIKQYEQELCEWFERVTHKKLNLKHPRTFNEKVQWLKLYDSSPIKTQLADKYLVRKWVKKKIGEKYLIPLLGVYDKFDDIDFNKLPDQFVIKCNHGSGYNIIVKDKSKLDLSDAKQKIDKWMHENFAFKVGFELQYLNMKPKIIIEQYMENKGSENLYDYKFWCFNGKVKYMQFRDDFSANLKMVFYDLDWIKQPFYYDHPLYSEPLDKPSNFSEMINIAKKLSEGFAFTCVDLYRLSDGTVYFGEMTFTRSSGVAKWNDERYNVMLGDMIKLPTKAYDFERHKYYKYKW